MPDATPGGGFSCPDLTTFCRLDELGLEVTGQRLEPGRAVLACRVVEPDEWSSRCGCEGIPRDTVVRRLAHEPFGWRPTTLEVTVRRYRCTGWGHVWRQDLSWLICLVRPHEAIAWERPKEVHFGLASPTVPTFQTTETLPTP